MFRNRFVTITATFVVAITATVDADGEDTPALPIPVVISGQQACIGATTDLLKTVGNNVCNIVLPIDLGIGIHGAINLAITCAGAVPDDCETLPCFDFDFDTDTDVDLIDLAGFQRCYTGPGPAKLAPCCTMFDSEPDGDVDLADFVAFGGYLQARERPCFGTKRALAASRIGPQTTGKVRSRFGPLLRGSGQGGAGVEP